MHAMLSARGRGTSITFLRNQVDGLEEVARLFKGILRGQEPDEVPDIDGLTVAQMRSVLGVYIAISEELRRRREYV